MSPPSPDCEVGPPPPSEASDSDVEYEEIEEEVEVEEEEEEVEEEEEEEEEEEVEAEDGKGKDKEAEERGEVVVEEEGGEIDMEIDELEAEDKPEAVGVHGAGDGRSQDDWVGEKGADGRSYGPMQLRAEGPLSGGGTYFCDGEMINTQMNNSCFTWNQNGSIPGGHSGGQENGAHYPATEVEAMGFQSKEDKKQMESRLLTHEVAPSNSPLGMESTERNKRAAIICSFFANGWCIRGSSCRFLHVKDAPDRSSKEQSFKKSNADNKGYRDDSNACPPGMLERLGSSSSGNSLAFASSSSSILHRDPSLPLAETEDSSKGDDGFINSYRNVIRNGLARSRYDEDYRIYSSLINKGNSIIFRSNFHPDYDPSANGSPRSTRLHESKVPTSHHLSNSQNLSFNAPPLALSTLSKSASSLDARSVLDRDYASCRSASVKNSSHLCGSRQAGYPMPSCSKMRKFAPYNWEPSVPFRPSFSFASVLPSLGKQYDQFIDSVEKKKSVGVSRPAQEQISGQNKRKQISGCENENSASSLYRITDQVPYYTHGKDSSEAAAAVETAENSVVVCRDDNATPEENSRLIKENSGVDTCNKTINYSCNQARLRNDLKDGKARNKFDKSIHQNTSAEDLKEPKLLKQFRFVLIDFVKALLRPIWDGNRLTKDAHNVIVKKAVEKVMNTLTPEMVPTSKDSIKQYLSLSEPKIVKLVEAYVDKYGKPSDVS